MEAVRAVSITDAILTADNVSETDYPAWSNAATYGVGDRVIIVAADVHKVFESEAASNTGHYPITDDGSHWVFVGATDKWAMFDGKTGTQTLNADSIDVTLTVSGRVTRVGCLNVTAAAVRVIQTDPVEGVVYDKTQILVSTSGIVDAWSYSFEPISRRTYAYFDDLPPYAGATIRIIISGSGTVGCGECLVGAALQIGGTQWGAQAGITDFSIKEPDTFGNFAPVERGFSASGTFGVWVKPASVDAVMAQLAIWRATPILYVGDSAYGVTLIYGFYKTASIALSGPTMSLLAIELEGL